MKHKNIVLLISGGSLLKFLATCSTPISAMSYTREKLNEEYGLRRKGISVKYSARHKKQYLTSFSISARGMEVVYQTLMIFLPHQREILKNIS